MSHDMSAVDAATAPSLYNVRAPCRMRHNDTQFGVSVVARCPTTPPCSTSQAFVAFDDDKTSDVAIFHGANGAFCSGWDLLKGREELEGNSDMSHLDFNGMQQRAPGPMGPSRLLLSKPVIAAIRCTLLQRPSSASCDCCRQRACCCGRNGACAVVR
jgi:hypothetical protein